MDHAEEQIAESPVFTALFPLDPFFDERFSGGFQIFGFRQTGLPFFFHGFLRGVFQRFGEFDQGNGAILRCQQTSFRFKCQLVQNRQKGFGIRKRILAAVVGELDRLTARTDGRQELRRMRGRQDEHALRRRFLQSFEKGILSGFVHPVRFVNDADFPAGIGHAAEVEERFEPAHGIDLVLAFPDGNDPGEGGGCKGNQIGKGSIGHFSADGAPAAGREIFIRMLAGGKRCKQRRKSRPVFRIRGAEKKRMSQPAGRSRILQRRDRQRKMFFKEVPVQIHDSHIPLQRWRPLRSFRKRK